MGKAIVQADGQDLEEIEHFPAQQEHGDHDGQDCQKFTKAHPIVVRLETLGDKAENIQRGKAKDQCPKDVINVTLLVGRLEDRNCAEDGGRRNLATEDRGQLSGEGQKLQAGLPFRSTGYVVLRPEFCEKSYIFLDFGSRGERLGGLLRGARGENILTAKVAKNGR